MQPAHQDEVAQDVVDTGYGDKEQRVFGVPHSAQHRADRVVAEDEKYAAAAEKGVLYRLVKRLGRRLHQRHNRAGKHQQQCSERGGEDGE